MFYFDDSGDVYGTFRTRNGDWQKPGNITALTHAPAKVLGDFRAWSVSGTAGDDLLITFTGDDGKNYEMKHESTGTWVCSQVGPPHDEVDLSKTPIAQRLIDYMRNLGQGNERSAGIDYLILNKSTGEARGKVWVRSRQHSGDLTDPITGRSVPIIAYDWTVTGTFNINIKGDVDCKVDLGRGIVMNCRDIATILAAAG